MAAGIGSNPPMTLNYGCVEAGGGRRSRAGTVFARDDRTIRGRRVTFNPDSLNFVRFKESFTFRKRKFILKTLVFIEEETCH